MGLFPYEWWICLTCCGLNTVLSFSIDSPIWAVCSLREEYCPCSSTLRLIFCYHGGGGRVGGEWDLSTWWPTHIWIVDRMLDALMETTCPLCILCWTIEVDVDGLSFIIPSLFQNLGINSCGYCYHWCLQKYLIARCFQRSSNYTTAFFLLLLLLELLLWPFF